MNKIITVALLLSVACFAKLSPEPADVLNLPDSFSSSLQNGLLVTPAMGVIMKVGDPDMPNTIITLALFDIKGFEFLPNSILQTNISDCVEAKLVYVSDSSFLVFCSGFGRSLVTLFSATASNTIQEASSAQISHDFYDTYRTSGSAFVNPQNNLYIMNSNNAESYLEIIRFNVKTFSFQTVVPDVLEALAIKNGTWSLQDIHCLPYDAGLALIINQGLEQVFASVYLNGTSIKHDLFGEDVFLTSVGRLRGSNFGYLVGTFNFQLESSFVAAWDFTPNVNAFVNYANVSGFPSLGGQYDGHFAIANSIFVYMNNATLAGTSGYVYELPMVESKILTGLVSSTDVKLPMALGNLGTGSDLAYVYSFSAQSDDHTKVALSRWTY